MVDLKEKKFLISKLCELLDEQIANSIKAANAAKESKSNETKSSAGDKFETGRAMMQKEQEMNESFLQQKKILKATLLQVDSNTKHNKVKFGSLVETETGKFFISIGLGKVFFENQKYFIVSTAAPVALKMLGLKMNDQFIVGAKGHKVVDIC